MVVVSVGEAPRGLFVVPGILVVVQRRDYLLDHGETDLSLQGRVCHARHVGL